MSYRHLDHSTDAIIEVTAPDLTSAFEVAGMSVVETIIDSSKIDERDKPVSYTHLTLPTNREV